MKELDEATIRANLQRRAGGDPDPATLERMTRAIVATPREQRPDMARWRGLPLPLSVRARVGLAAVLILALALIAVPFMGAPSRSEPPPVGTASMSPHSSAPPTAASTIAPGGVQVLTLDQLQRVVARGDQDPYSGNVVVADIQFVPRPASLTCGGEGECPIGGVAGSDPPIAVFPPAKNPDLLQSSIPMPRESGPLIARIRGANALELAGVPTLNSDNGIVWSVPSFVRAADQSPRTMELRPDEFSVGLPYVVDGKLASGPGLFCTFQTASTDPISGFECGVAGWLAPADVADPNAIIDGWTGPRASAPADWVRVQNRAYQKLARADGSTTPPSDTAAVRGLYVVFPVLKYDSAMCFACDAGAVAILYARLEPLPVP